VTVAAWANSQIASASRPLRTRREQRCMVGQRGLAGWLRCKTIYETRFAAVDGVLLTG
jgi:hypothetical protein